MITRKPLLVALATTISSFAFSTTFYGIDPGVGPGSSRPNSDAAHADFITAVSGIGPVSTFDFESQAVGNFSSLDLGDATVTLTNTDTTATPGISDGLSPNLGYNTTSGGSHHLRVVPVYSDTLVASATFDFDSAISSFGCYMTGVSTINGNVKFSYTDGSTNSIDIVGASNGGVLFFGYADAGASITQITMEVQGTTANSRDIFGIDDVQYTAAVPEPASMVMLGLGAVALLKRRRTRG